MLALPVHNPQTKMLSSLSSPEALAVQYAAPILIIIDMEIMTRENIMCVMGIETRDMVDPITGKRKGLK